MKTNHTGGDKLEKELRELIWYELGDGLNATDVNEAVISILKWHTHSMLAELESIIEFRKNETSSTYTVIERTKERIAELRAKLDKENE